MTMLRRIWAIAVASSALLVLLTAAIVPHLSSVQTNTTSMATVASQIILHPTLSQTLKVWGTTVGRDKTYRAVQYFARFYAWFLISRGYKVDAVRWNALKTHLATARKLLRLGKPIEHLQAALQATGSSAVAPEKLATIARQLSYFGYLSYDAIVWAQTIKLITLKPDTAAKVNKTANRFWFAGILFSIINGLFKTARLANETRQLRTLSASEKDVGAEADRQVKLRAIYTARYATRFQFVVDLFDLWLPASNIGLVNLNDGVLGIFGLISSILGFNSQWASVNGKK